MGDDDRPPDDAACSTPTASDPADDEMPAMDGSGPQELDDDEL